MAPVATSIEPYFDRAVAWINRCPGINLEDLIARAAIPETVTTDENGRTRKWLQKNLLIRLIGRLREHGIQIAPAGGIYKYERFYPEGFPIPQPKLFVPAPRSDGGLKTWIDPTIRGTWQPPAELERKRAAATKHLHQSPGSRRETRKDFLYG